MTEKSIGAQIKTLRTKADKTQEELAAALEWPVWRLQKLEQGRQRLLLSEAVTVAKALGCAVGDVAGYPEAGICGKPVPGIPAPTGLVGVSNLCLGKPDHKGECGNALGAP